MSQWVAVKEKDKGEFYVAKRTIGYEKWNKTEVIYFRDWNGHILSLSDDKAFADDWCESRNKIEGLNHI